MTDVLATTDKLSVFISYSRDDLAFADQLFATLELAGFVPTMDRVGIHGAEAWEETIQTLIREADTVVFVLSISSAASKVCAWEVEQAVEMGKRIIPVLSSPLSGAAPPSQLTALNYIFFYPEPTAPSSGWADGLRKLDKALRTDRSWLREHTRLLQRAVEWHAGGRASGRLLSGADIIDAEAWASRQPREAPQPTALHLAFIQASAEWEAEQAGARERDLAERERLVADAESSRAAREAAQSDALAAADRERRQAVRTAQRTFAGLIAASVLAMAAGGAGVLAYWERDRAEEQTRQAVAHRGLAELQTKRAEAAAAKAAQAVEVVSLMTSQMSDSDKKVLTRDDVDRLLSRRLQVASDSGNVVATRMLGLLSFDGRGATQDFGKAKKFWEQAAIAGDPAAMSFIGLLYTNGSGVNKDFVKAREWFEKAASLGDAEALHQLGDIHFFGHRVPANPVKAREYWERAAAAGNGSAMQHLGEAYAVGRDVPSDSVKALRWYEKAAATVNADAMSNPGRLYLSGKAVPQDYAKAREWYEKAAAAGDVGAMAAIASLYENGWGVPQDYSKAREWYEKAAAAGDARAMGRIGQFYRLGLGVQPDATKQREWLEKAAAGDDRESLHFVGDMYANGEGGVPANITKAIEFWVKAAALGDRQARLHLDTAAKDGVPIAMRNIGVLYQIGRGESQDNAKAREWYTRAVEAGDADAKGLLQQLDMEVAVAAGRHGEALRLQFARTAEIEASETADGKKPGPETASALGSLAWRAIFAREPGQALAAAERALAISPDKLWIETNRALALMYLGRADDARALFLAHKDKPVANNDNKHWQEVIGEDFTELRKAGLDHQQMTEIEAALGVNR